MITESQMYWLTRLDYICLIVRIIAILGGGIMLVFTIIGGICLSEEDISKKTYTRLLFLWIIALAGIVGTILTPTTKEMCAIKLVPIIANNEQVQELPNKVVDLANEWLDELKPKSTNKENQ